MEKGKIWKTKFGIIAAGVAVTTAAAVFLIAHFGKSDEAYRSIQIYEVGGTASIERDGIGMMEAVENLYLESGDRITVSVDSFMRLKLDDDKYILVEENSVLSIVAEGTKQDSLTTIKLEQGAVTNEIRNPLSAKSSYEVATPNSVMAVRGTVFRVAISNDEKGVLYTTVDTFEGAVGVRRVLPDGSVQEEDAHISGGNEVIIFMDEEITEYLSEPQEIRYEELPVQTLSFLKESSDSGREIVGISPDKIEDLIAEKESQEAAAKAEETQELKDDTAEDMSELEEEALEPVIEEPENEAIDQTLAQDEVPQDEGVLEEQKQKPEQVLVQQNPTEQEETTTQSPDSSSDESSDSENTSSGESSSEKSSYTVTFYRSDGSVFGTQTIKSGERATEPKLKPAASGKWDFDFTQSITADTAIRWTN